jgi:hypothetical protein
VLDMGRPGAWFPLSGGTSGRWFGPGYCEGVREWPTGRFFPLGNTTGEPPEPDTAAG